MTTTGSHETRIVQQYGGIMGRLRKQQSRVEFVSKVKIIVKIRLLKPTKWKRESLQKGSVEAGSNHSSDCSVDLSQWMDLSICVLSDEDAGLMSPPVLPVAQWTFLYYNQAWLIELLRYRFSH